jgi:hypothetical protein
MKTKIKGLFIMAVFMVLQASNKLYAQTRLTVSVAGIEYDDAGFTKLKESIKKNTKVQGITQSFSENTARLTLTYNGDAAQLWDEIPAALKQPFKISSIETNRIDLQLKNAIATSGTQKSNANPVTNTTAADDDCKNCYWNMCRFDVIKSIGGKIYKGVITEYGTVYYNCDNGIVLQTTLNINAYGSTVIAGTDTILISSGPVGTRWGVVNVDEKFGLLSTMSGVDLSMKNNGGYTLIAKNLKTEARGKTYNDVIVVNYKGISKDAFTGTNFYSVNYYYAKGIGLVRTDTLNFDSDPLAAINKANDIKTVYSGGSVVKNGIDATIIGLWKYHDAKTNADTYYRFNADGTMEFYAGSVAEANKSKGINHWKIEEGGYNKNGVAIIDITWAGGNYTMREYLQKKNDPATKKPALLLNDLVFISADNKPMW